MTYSMNICTMRLGGQAIVAAACVAVLACPRDSLADITLTGVQQ